jgi:hypothetical protein
MFKKITAKKTKKMPYFNGNMPDVSMLTDKQLEIYDILSKIKLNEFTMHVLTGYAGTGKTFLVGKIINQILFDNKTASVAVTATTHKAVKVLKELSRLNQDTENIEFFTLHSLLGLKREINSDGTESYVEDSFGSKVEDYSLIIVDEASMLDNKLFDTLAKHAKKNLIPLLFIGDDKQIPPVNGGEFVLFTKKIPNKHTLVDIIRQANGNPIIETSKRIREGEKLDFVDNINDNFGLKYIKLGNEDDYINDYFNNEQFKTDPNYVKILAWTNSAVDYYNSKVRKAIYGENCERICIGEKMVLNKPVVLGKKVLLNNNDEFEVLSYDVETETSGYPFKYYSLDVESDDKRLSLKLLHEDSFLSFNNALESLKKEAIKTKDTYARRMKWVNFYKLAEKYIDAKYNYALTVHKSQGSTFDNSIVIYCDILRVKDIDERNKLLYTSITRAKKNLYLVY